MRKVTRKIYLCFLLALPIVVFSQQKGIEFEKRLTWQEVQHKARSEKKFIFVDCYATWCVPCKQMDEYVYSSDSVGDYINENFISVKVQMDTSKNDDELTKKWYSDANAINQQYQVNTLPTFLFFSPEGSVVHKGVGYRDVQQLILLAKDALNTQRQYFTLLGSYKQEHKDYAVMPYMANTANSLKEYKVARKIAGDYIENYLLHLKTNELYTRKNVEFIRGFTTNSKDKGFEMFYLHGDKMDKLMGDAIYSQSFVDYIISKEEIDPEVLSASKMSSASPDWGKIKSIITRKYGESYADRTISAAKVRWYGFKRDWPAFTKSTVNLVTRYGSTMKNWDLNGHGMTIFLYSTDKKEIDVAVLWMEKVVRTEADSANLLPASLDTYANLLYKSGRKEEAKAVEEKALNMAIEYEIPNFTKDFQSTLEKMQKGEPTWLLE